MGNANRPSNYALFASIKMVLTTYADFRFYCSILMFSKQLLSILYHQGSVQGDYRRKYVFEGTNDYAIDVKCLNLVYWPKNLYIM